MKKAKTPAYPLSWEDSNRLIAGLFKDGKYRHSAYVRLAVDFGFRYVDTSKLTWGDVLRNRVGVLHITEQKTGKPATRTIYDNTKSHILSCWEALEHPEYDEPIMLSQKPGRDGKKRVATVQNLNQIMKRKETGWIAQYDLTIHPQNFSTHSFRKTFGMKAYEKGGVVLAKKVLNHESLEVTNRYLLLDERDVLAFNPYE
ncbi:MAG: tyrosine-type recombinase/integrase [Bacteroidota bacterium]